MPAGLLLIWMGAWMAQARGAAADIWPVKLAPFADEAALNRRLTGLGAAAATVPPNLEPAVRFEAAFVRAVAGAEESEWLPAMRGFAQAPDTDPVAAALRDVAKAWIARVEMREIGTVLDDFYAQNVHYPAALSDVESALPNGLKVDPWGEAWVYRTHAPEGFANEALQRYTLGPKRYPDLGTLKEATSGRQPFTPPAWRIASRTVGAGNALEFSNGAGVIALLQPGGKVGVYTLMYIGNGWALLAATDQLFTVKF